MKVLRTVAVILLILGIVASVAIGAATKKPAMASMNITGMLDMTPDLSTLAKLVKDAGLTSTLQKAGPYTIYAPTNEAFKKLPKTTLASLTQPANKEKLKSILLFHVVKGKSMAADLLKMKIPSKVKSVQGADLTLTHTKTMVMVDKAKVTKADVKASNGVIHEIDTVLMPPAAKAAPVKKTMKK